MQNVEKAAEPSMEDILASIRKIISEEPVAGRPAAPSAAPPAPPPAAAKPAAAPPPIASKPVAPVAPAAPVVPPVASAPLAARPATVSSKQPTVAQPIVPASSRAAFVEDDLSDLLEVPAQSETPLVPAPLSNSAKSSPVGRVVDQARPVAATSPSLPPRAPALPDMGLDPALNRLEDELPAQATALKDLGSVVPGLLSGRSSEPAPIATPEVAKPEATLSPVSSLFPPETKRTTVPIFGLDAERAPAPVNGAHPIDLKSAVTKPKEPATVQAKPAATPPLPPALPSRAAVAPPAPQLGKAQTSSAAPQAFARPGAPAVTTPTVTAAPMPPPQVEVRGLMPELNHPPAEAKIVEAKPVEQAPVPPAPRQTSVVAAAGVAAAAVSPPVAPKPEPAPIAPPAAVSAAAPADANAPKTLEDQVASMLRPMLREWLDKNMPGIVEKALKDDDKKA
jgi:cell pole-organizing protein PopZ